MGRSISMDEVREYELNAGTATHATVDDDEHSGLSPSAEPLNDGNDDNPHVLTFAQLQALIENGREDQIPNNKVIPNVLNVRLLFVFSYLLLMVYRMGLLVCQRLRREKSLGNLRLSQSERGCIFCPCVFLCKV